ncbi:unnamed protein product [Medioppia subpectinata]|uniref:Uncharacterized protein n=1 Tax=Medioppia subpectinata TaxID=1979941 RepID=A0A7R9KWM9_9ACAR|nr:unnamed protein product [Medioppia subpectinata]CAG2111116.1 unnamed protein product [Medioppia subpectinata]
MVIIKVREREGSMDGRDGQRQEEASGGAAGGSGSNAAIPVRLSLKERFMKMIYSKEEFEAYMIAKSRKRQQKETTK